MKELSIFIDESGDFGKYDEHCPYYLVSLVLHEKQNDINNQVAKLNLELQNLGLNNHTVHTGPLIRREKSYSKDNVNFRFKVFNKLFRFTKNVNIKYKNILVDKKQNKSSLDINRAISKELANFIKENFVYFNSFDKVIIYYDNGQIQLTNILVSIFSTLLSDSFEYRCVYPSDYKLFQTADLICTLSLIYHKLECDKSLTKSEKMFFGSPNKFKKNYMKYLLKRKFN